MAAWFACVLNMSLTGSLVIGLVLAARWLLRKQPKIFSYALWSVVLFRLLCPVSVAAPVSLLGLMEAPAASGAGPVTYVEYVVTQAPETEPAPTPALLESTPQEAREAVPSQSGGRAALAPMALAARLWLAGAAVLALVGLCGTLRFRRQLTGAVRRVKNVYLVDHLGTAFVAGLVFPKIYLPSDLPEEQLVYILAHERHHIRRGDHVTRHLACLALCLHWFNPLVWLAFVLSGKDLEMSCDEAVIRKLGDHIRADYSASLLTLARGRRYLAATPLAFGEGDTKGRIQNMLHWKKPKKLASALCFVLCFALLTACAANPPAVVTTEGELTLPTLTSEPRENTPTQTIRDTDSFQSDDGTVDISLALDGEISAGNLPVVEVAPRYLTGEDAHRAALAIFGEAGEFYEQRPVLSDKNHLSKAEMEEMYEKWQTWLDADYMTELYGSAEDAQREMETVQVFVDNYPAQYALASDTDPRVPCQWTLKTSASYLYDEEGLADADTSDDNMEVQAEVILEGRAYRFIVSTRNREDFQVNNIHASLGTMEGPGTVARDEAIAQLCRKDKPGQSQISAARQKAEAMLAQMDLGQWEVDSCYLKTNTFHGTPEYMICVTARPVVEGVTVLAQPQLNQLRGTGTEDSHYYLTQADFQFAPGGELIDITVNSTIDVTQVTAQGETLSMEELLSRAKSHFRATSRDGFVYDARLLADMEVTAGEPLDCAVLLTQASYGLARVKSGDGYRYVPALMLAGDVEYRGRNTGTVYDSVARLAGLPDATPLLCLNAIDGSVIPLGR